MPPGIVHAVEGVENALFWGCHFYHHALLPCTLRALWAEHKRGDEITNTDHIAAMLFLQRMAMWCHRCVDELHLALPYSIPSAAALIIIIKCSDDFEPQVTMPSNAHPWSPVGIEAIRVAKLRRAKDRGPGFAAQKAAANRSVQWLIDWASRSAPNSPGSELAAEIHRMECELSAWRSDWQKECLLSIAGDEAAERSQRIIGGGSGSERESGQEPTDLSRK